MSAPSAGAGPDAATCAAVRISPLPVLLVRLRDAVIVEASDAVAAVFGGPRPALLGRPVYELLLGPWMPEANLLLLAAHAVEGMRTRAMTWRSSDGGTFTAAAWLSGCGPPPAAFGVAVLLSGDGGLRPAVAATTATGAPPLAVGTVNVDWVVDRVSAEVEELLGVQADAAVGASLRFAVHPADLPALLIAVGHCAHRQEATAVTVRLRTPTPAGWVAVRAVVSPVEGQRAPAFGFAIARAGAAGGAEERAHELERQLRMLASELEVSRLAGALGRMPTARELPALAALTARELDIAARLLAGDRVPLIARSLFLSTSTVRNHLTRVFRKLEVGSQQELLDVLRPASQEVPPTTDPAVPADPCP